MSDVDYACGFWAIMEGAEPILAADRRIVDKPSKRMQVSSGPIAIVDLSGPLSKENYWGDGTSTVTAREQIRAAMADPNVSGILLRVDSPGGTVSGTVDLAADINAAKAQKPVVAYIEDLGASGAYWAASQAEKVYANSTALVGSIGTFMRVADLSAMAASQGIKVHVIRAGAHKGAGTPGTEITADHLTEMQRVVNGLNTQFVESVANGRGISIEQAQSLADGRVHVGQEAVKLGLIDGVKSFEQVYQELVGMAPKQVLQQQNKKGKSMAAASYQEIVSSCGGFNTANPDDAMFACDQQSKGADVDQVRIAWGQTLAARVSARDAELAAAKAEAAAAKKQAQEAVATAKTDPASGSAFAALDTIKHGKESKTAVAESETVDALAEFPRLVQEKVKAGLTPARATSVVAKANPELHKEYVAAFNESRR